MQQLKILQVYFLGDEVYNQSSAFQSKITAKVPSQLYRNDNDIN